MRALSLFALLLPLSAHVADDRSIEAQRYVNCMNLAAEAWAGKNAHFDAAMFGLGVVRERNVRAISDTDRDYAESGGTMLRGLGLLIALLVFIYAFLKSR